MTTRRAPEQAAQQECAASTSRSGGGDRPGKRKRMQESEMSAADRAGDGIAHEHSKGKKFDRKSPSEENPSNGTGAEGVQFPSVTEALADELRHAYELDDRVTHRRFAKKLLFSADTGLWYKRARVFVPGDPRLKQ